MASSYAAGLTVQKAQESPQLSLLRKEAGEAVTEAYMALLLDEVLAFVPHKLDADKIAMYAKMLQNSYWYLRLDDFVLCFRNGINGQYGKIYHAVTYATLTEWVEKYLEEKEQHCFDRHQVAKTSNPLPELPEEAAKQINQIAEKIKPASAGWNDPAYKDYSREYRINQMRQASRRKYYQETVSTIKTACCNSEPIVKSPYSWQCSACKNDVTLQLTLIMDDMMKAAGHPAAIQKHDENCEGR